MMKLSLAFHPPITFLPKNKVKEPRKESSNKPAKPVKQTRQVIESPS